MSHISMPMLGTLYHHDDRTAPFFVAPKSHEARHCFVEPIVSSGNSDAMQARDKTFPGAVTTTDAKGSTIIASASIIGIELG